MTVLLFKIKKQIFSILNYKKTKKYFISKTIIIPFEKVKYIDRTESGFFWVFYSSENGACFSVDDSQLDNYFNYLNNKK